MVKQQAYNNYKQMWASKSHILIDIELRRLQHIDKEAKFIYREDLSIEDKITILEGLLQWI